MLSYRYGVMAAVGLFASAAGAQQADPVDGEEIVVTASGTERGAVVGDIKPEVQLSPADIRSYGVASVGDLLAQLGPQTRSARGSGRPVVLLNGRRISGFSEIRDLPAEAIERVDILPEEVALKYGYPADQRVVNFVLRPRFRAWTGEVSGGMATEGGAENGQASANYLRINREGRFSMDVRYSRSASLTEAERDIIAAAPQSPYDLTGNIASLNGGEIDPALSALAGSSVTVAGVPDAALTRPLTLADLAARANQPNITDQRRYRTLKPETETAALNLVYNRVTSGGTGITINGRVQLDDSERLNGLPTARITLPESSPFSPFSGPVGVYRYVDAFGPLEQTVKSSEATLGLTLDGRVGAWQWSVLGNYERIDSRTRTDRGIDIVGFQSEVNGGANPFATLTGLASPLPLNRARTLSNSASLDALISGPLFDMPAGRANLSLKIVGSHSDADSTSVRAGVEQDTHFSRDIIGGQANLDVPLTSRRSGFGGDTIGDLSFNANLAAQELSDFGTLMTAGFGLNWSPIRPLRFIVSHTVDEAAPSAAQLQGAQILTPGVPVFDPLTGTTVFVTQISGGAPELRPSERRVTKLEVNLRPLEEKDLSINASFVRTRTSDAIANFPTPTAAILAAFPERFLRDASGTIVQIDTRPVNFTETASDVLRWGANLSLPVGAPPNRQGGQPGAGAPPQGPGPGGGGGMGRFGPGRFGGGRFQFAVYHSVNFRNDVLIRPGVPLIDLLNGGALASGGGQPRHEVDVQAGIVKNGLGLRLSGNWQSATHVDAGPGNSAGALDFDDLATVNLRLFANLGQMPNLVQKHAWLRGTRVTLSINNLFNERQRVTDATGATPLAYQPAYLDPAGRTISISFRKLFFTPPQRRPAS